MSRNNTVLLVGLESDPHVLRVAEHCRDLGARTLIYDRHNSQHALELAASSESITGRLLLGNELLDFGDIGAVWWRTKPFTESDYSGVPSSISEAFMMREWRSTLKSLEYFTSHAKWINHVEAQDTIALKPRQLAIARTVGLRIPRTVITNNADAAIDFMRCSTRTIYKVLSHYFTVSHLNSDEVFGETIYTTEISLDVLQNSRNEIRAAPIQLQELLVKSYELRVNIVGTSIFAARIASQEHDDTVLDWRHSQLRPMYSATTLDTDTERKLLAFHQAVNLEMAAYDLVVPVDGSEPYFLECNAGGQWIWIEEFTGQPVTATLARLLVNGHL